MKLVVARDQQLNVKAPQLAMSLLRKAATFAARHLVIEDFAESCPERPRGRALLSYLVLPLLPPSWARDRCVFSNRGIAQQLVTALNELGYAVDIVNFDNTVWRPERHYDLFIGHGGFNFEQIRRCLPSGAVSIYFSTGLYWKEANRLEAERFFALAQRRGHFLPPDRATQADEEYATRSARGIICLGNSDAARSYSSFPHVVHINNAAYPVEVDLSRKDYVAGRSRFLFFSGRGNVHKGLDLLLEAFASSQLELHICQHMEAAFARAFAAELRSPNIHVHGYVKMRSPRFLELARRCDWVIHPTASEGQPGSVVECMAHGLVPILPKTANIDLEDFGLPLEGCTVEDIARVSEEASRADSDRVRARSASVVAAVARSYSVEGFRAAVKDAIERILREAQ